MSAVASAVLSVGDIPVPPEVIIRSTFSPTAAKSALTTPLPSATTVGAGVETPRPLSQSTMIGPQRSSYTPAAARVEAITTRPDLIVCSSRERSSLSPRPRPRLAALFAQHPDVVDARCGIHGLDHVVDGERGDADSGQRLHLDAGAVGAAHGRCDGDLGVGDLEVDV